MDDIQAALDRYLDSEHVKLIHEVREGRFGLNLVSGMRNLTQDEITSLVKRNNYARDWNTILVSHDFIPDFIYCSRFAGRCSLGRFDGSQLEAKENISLGSGIYDSVIANSYICGNAAVHRCGMVSNYIVSPGCVLQGNGSITAGGGLLFANGTIIPLGPETGERSMAMFAELNMGTACEIISKKSGASLYDEFIRRYSALCMLDSGYIGPGTIIKNTVSVTDSFIGGSAFITGALNISGSAILSSPEEHTSAGHGVIIEGSIVQHGCRVSSGASLHSSLLMEHSEAEKHCIINSSIIGPNSVIGEGEITSTLAGPFTAAHHQSLLIAAVWTGGRGNIGYGANVGSNHTSRLPDQELFPGEGMFFGLGSSIKFPADYRLSPYTVISTGAVTLPQKLEFPFSLVTQPPAHYGSVPPLFNELRPGWMLSDNLYTLVRNEEKYRKRNKSRRDAFEFTIMRPDIIDMMVTARARLRTAGSREIYTESDIPGTGKNFITPSALAAGLEAYNFFIRYYSLLMYMKRTARVLAGGGQISAVEILKPDNELRWWQHGAAILEGEGLSAENPSENIEEFMAMTRKIYVKTLASRQKDYDRGRSLIDDYAMYHDLPENDPVVKNLRKNTDIEIKRAEQILAILKNS